MSEVKRKAGGQTTHGLNNSRTYRSWSAMKQRCSNPNCIRYNHYGGRGITVCERWMKFENFLADMGLRPDGTSLDRINNDLHYEPGNCRRATPGEQNRNQSVTHFITYGGETLCIADWAIKMGIHQNAMFDRVKNHGEVRAIEMGPCHKNRQRFNQKRAHAASMTPIDTKGEG